MSTNAKLVGFEDGFHTFNRTPEANADEDDTRAMGLDFILERGSDAVRHACGTKHGEWSRDRERWLEGFAEGYRAAHEAARS